MPLGIRKEVSRSSILEDKPTWVRIAKSAIFFADFYKGPGENVKKNRLMRNKRNS
jgi:hypothetical protein